MTIPELCGWLSGGLTMVAMLPQTVRVWRFRRDPYSLLSLSVWSAGGRLATMCLWLAYTATVGAVPLMLANTVLVSACTLTLTILLRSRRLYRSQLATGLA